jgi:phosphate transport system ATP-binding protein
VKTVSNGTDVGGKESAPSPKKHSHDKGDANVRIAVKNLDFYYGKFHALKKVTLDMYNHQVTALIGPSGCGKSTFLRCLNRMNDLYPDI